MFEHSVKVPRIYKAAAKSLKEALETGRDLRKLLNDLDSKRLNTNAIYALLVETVKRETALCSFFETVRLFDEEPRLDPYLARVLLVELVLGRKAVTGDSKPVLTVSKYYREHRTLLGSLLDGEPTVVKPRYVRVNTLQLGAADAVRSFQDEGWNLVRCTSGSYDDYLRQLENLGESDFVPDYHVKVVFAFPPKTSFAHCPAYVNGQLFLQDKATCLAGHILAPTPGSTVLDMCAAPGMKTTHLASILKNEGKIYSIEQDASRCETLRQFVESSGATCVSIINKDVLAVTKNECPDVDYVLLDPSCSGSGINRLDNNDPERDLNSGRLRKLSRFQAKLLRHALNEFRTARRVVYSTCSLYPQENEEVVKDVLLNHKGRFGLVSAKERLNGKWNNVGDPRYADVGDKCIYARPDSDYTSGFFIAVFERVEDDKEAESTGSKVQIDVSDPDTVVKKSKKSTKKTPEDAIEPLESPDVDNNEVESISRNESVKKKRKHRSNSSNDDTSPVLSNDVQEISVGKKKRKKHQDIIEDSSTAIDESNQDISASKKERKKKKKN